MIYGFVYVRFTFNEVFSNNYLAILACMLYNTSTPVFDNYKSLTNRERQTKLKGLCSNELIDRWAYSAADHVGNDVKEPIAHLRNLMWNHGANTRFIAN